MKKEALKRLWFPVSILITFCALALYNKDILFEFKEEAISQTQMVFAYAIKIGIWLSVAHFVNRLIIVFFWDGLLQKILGTPVPRLLKDVLTIIIYLIAITGIASVVFDQSISGFWATSGVVTLILGFALKNVILDVFTGLAINIDRPYRIGDWIEVHGSGSEHVTGRVEEINWRTTRLWTVDDSIIILPNSTLGLKVVTNLWGSGPASRFDTIFCLDYAIPTERALRVLTAGAKSAVGQKGILETPAPSVIVHSTSEMGVEYKVRFFTEPWRRGATLGVSRGHITEAVLQHLHQAGITPAYPKQDMFFAEMPARHLDINSLDDQIKLLGQTELFSYLESDELRTLASGMERKKFEQGQRLINQGDSGDSMFIVSEGLLHAFITTEDGDNEIKVGQIVPGEFFGEMSLLTGEARSASIVAVTGVIAHELSKDDMNVLLEKRPAIAEIISAVVAERRIRNSKTMADATAEERIEETRSLAAQIMAKMKSFFAGVFDKKAVRAHSGVTAEAKA